MTENERNAVSDECFEHNDHLRASRHLVGEMALQPPETAVTLYWKNGKVATTDGPYAETKEQLGGLSILEAAPMVRVKQPLYLNSLRQALATFGPGHFTFSRNCLTKRSLNRLSVGRVSGPTDTVRKRRRATHPDQTFP